MALLNLVYSRPSRKIEGIMTTEKSLKAKIASKSQKITAVSFAMLFFVMCARAVSLSYSSEGSIEIPEITEDSELTISSGVTVTNTAALTGIGKLTVNGGGTLVLTKDSSCFSGGMYVGKATVSIRTGGALGTGPVTIQGKTNAKGSSRVCFDNGSLEMTVANNFVIESSGGREKADASLVFVGDKSGNVSLLGRIEGESGVNTVLRGENATVISFENLVSSDTVNCCGTVYYYFKGKVRSRLLWAYSASGQYQPYVHLSSGMSEIGTIQSRANATIDFDADNAAGGAVLIFGGKGLNLNGYSQLASCISVEQAYSINGGDGDSIATLTLTGGVSSSSSALLNEKLNLVIDDRSAAGDFVQIQSGGTHTMSGEIAVRRGTYSLTGAATFKSLTGLSIGAFGKLCVAPETGMPFPNDGTVDVAFATGAQYEGNPIEINAKSLTLDGVVQEPGYYTHDNAPAIPEGVTVFMISRTLTLGTSGEIDFAGTQGAVDGYWLVTVPSGVAVTNTTALAASSGINAIEFTGGGTFVQLAESPDFDASVRIGKATLVATKSKALGVGNVAINGYDKENGTSRLYFDNGEEVVNFPNNIKIKNGCTAPGTSSQTKAAIVFAGGGQGKVALSGNVVTGTGKFVFYGFNNTTAEFSNKTVVSELYLLGSTYYDFIGDIVSEMLYAYAGTGSSAYPPKLRLSSSENDIGVIKSRKSAQIDICAPNGIGGGAIAFSSIGSGGVCLNGNCQTAAYVDNEGSSDAGTLSGGTGNEVAVLTVTGGVSKATTMVKLTDSLSLVVDDKGTAGDFVQVFSNGVHTMSGVIAVKRGTLELKGDATFKKVSSVEVDGGELVLATDSATFGNETEVRSGNIDMTISAGGRVTVSDGLAVNVNKANVGGRGLPAGNYTGIGGPAGAIVLPQLGGTGVLHVCKTSGMGFVVILK